MKKSPNKLLKILIAEDDKDDRFFASLAFKEAGGSHTVNFVEDGEELMQYLHDVYSAENSSGLPNLILLDLNMPKKDGREALKEIKSDIRFHKLNVVIFSTCISMEDKKYTTNLGVSYHIIKPLNFYELVSIIKEVCNSFAIINDPIE